MAEQPGITLSGHFQGHTIDSHPEKWNSLWEDHNYTPWDRGGPSLALSDILEQRSDLFDQPGRTARKALVPGCGRGHDVLLLASLGYDAYGLEVSPTALKEARKNAEAVKGADGKSPENIHWLAGNFFEDQWAEGAGAEKFDLIFDYTVSGMAFSGLPGYDRRMLTSTVLLRLATSWPAALGQAHD